MIFLFKEKPIVVDCFTTRDTIYKTLRIEPASQFIPKWWKDMASTYINAEQSIMPLPTIKTCDGLIDLFKTGFILPLWTDVALKVVDNGFMFELANGKKDAEFHDKFQWQDIPEAKNYGHLKLMAPWKLKTKSDINFYLTWPQWHYPLNFPLVHANGIFSFKNRYEWNPQLFVNLTKNYELILNAGQPIGQIIPLTDKKVKLAHHLITESEYKKLNYTSISFFNSFKKVEKLTKNAEKKCPFHK
jgi:hypothetical protein